MTESAMSQTQPIGEFFTVTDTFSVNLIKLEDNASIPDDIEFEAQMPELFKLASNMAGSEQDLLQQLKMDNHQSPVLVNYLEQMNQRMVMMLGYLLRYEDDPSCRHQGIEYGGGGLRVVADERFTVGDSYQAKIFVRAESLAIFCYLTCTQVDDDKATFEFTRISEPDREHFIRASLHSQSRQLKQRAQARQQHQDEQ